MSSPRIVALVSTQIAAPGTGVDILTAARVRDEFDASGDISIPTRYEGYTLRINISCAAASKVKLEDDNDLEIFLNAGAALVAGQNMIEDFIPDPARTYNLQLDTTDGAINHLAIVLVPTP